MNHSSVSLGLAAEAEREMLYRLRHDVYAAELGQHPVKDAPDNARIAAALRRALAL